MTKVIFFGNGPLADSALATLKGSTEILFHARTREDLETVKKLKNQNPEAIGILASFGVLIKQDVLGLFEPEGILNIHPSLLPLYRGASPIESAILNGDNSFSVSIMKLVKKMDAGPIYHQITLSNLPLDKSQIYHSLAQAGTQWICDNLEKFTSVHNKKATPASVFPNYHLQDDSKASFTQKLDKSMSSLSPGTDSSDTTLRKIIAYQGFPKPKYTFFNQDVIILSAHIENNCSSDSKSLFIKCADGKFIVVDFLQPLSRKPMDSKSFLNGLRK